MWLEAVGVGVGVEPLINQGELLANQCLTRGNYWLAIEGKYMQDSITTLQKHAFPRHGGPYSHGNCFRTPHILMALPTTSLWESLLPR